MKRYLFSFALLLALVASPARAATSAPFMEEHEALKKFLFEEPKSRVHVAFGISPLSILNSRILFSFDILQVYYLGHYLDWEVLSASFGFGLGGNELASSQEVLVRTSPKIRLGSFFSIGPLVGLEYVKFSNAQTKIIKDNINFTQNFEPLSKMGWVYGGELSETFKIGDNYLLKVNELVYKETYSTTDAGSGLTYFYQDPGLQTDTTPLKASTVVALEFALLF